MGTTLEIWRARVGNWNAAGRRSSTKKKAGVRTLVKALMNSVFQFFIALTVLSIFSSMTKLDNQMGQARTRHVVFLSSIAATILSLSAKTAEVSSKLMHDVETNPGPNCSGVSSFLESNSLKCLLLIRVAALLRANLVSSLELSTPTSGVWILLRGFLLAQLTPSVVFNATSPPWQQQSKRSPTGSILTLAERA